MLSTTKVPSKYARIRSFIFYENVNVNVSPEQNVSRKLNPSTSRSSYNAAADASRLARYTRYNYYCTLGSKW